MENYHNDDMTMFYQFGKSLECRWQSAQGCGLPKRAFILGAYVYLPKIQFDYSMVEDMTPGIYKISFAAKTMGEMEMRPCVIIHSRDGETYESSAAMPMAKPEDGWVYYSEEFEISWEGDIRILQFQMGTTESSPGRLAGFYLDKVELSKISDDEF